MNLAFTKMHGLGNDFIVIEDLEADITLDESQVIALCDRHRGIGADGIMLLRRGITKGDKSADYEWWFANADGSRPEMCGNGIRCAARYLFDKGLIPENDEGAQRVSILTDAGHKYITVERAADGAFARAIVEMGRANLDPAAVGARLSGNVPYRCDNLSVYSDTPMDQTDEVESILLDYPFEIEYPASHVIDTMSETIPITCVSMGNPHTIIDVEHVGVSLDDVPVELLGPLIETHEAFTKGTNVEFIEVVDRNTLNLRVWERGCGETNACGTGACAAAVSAFLHNEVGSDVTVRLRGGDLHIEIDPETLDVKMAGPAEVVYAGSVDLNRL